MSTPGLPRVGNLGGSVAANWRVATFALGASLITGILFGLMPAFAGLGVDVHSPLKDARHRGGGRPGRARQLLVVAEFAMTVVLLTGAGLLVRTQAAIMSVDAGFDAANTLVMRTTLDEDTVDPLPNAERTLERLRALPGIESATLTCGPCLPLMIGLTMPWAVPEFPPRGGGPRSRWVAASEDYFEVFGIRVLAGRVFRPEDRAEMPPVMVISERMREIFIPDASPIGRRLVIGQETEPREIVGIVDDVPDGDLRREVAPRMYVPVAQLGDSAATILASNNFAVRTEGNPYRYREATRDIVLESMGVPVSQVISGEDFVDQSLGSHRLNLLLMSVFALAAVVLAAVGIFGLVACAVDQRRQEIGIRMALGAPRGNIRRLVLRQGLVPALGGTAAGRLGSYWLAELLANQLFEVEPRDPWVFTLVPLVVLLVALLASWVPAGRAGRIAPLDALREQ